MIWLGAAPPADYENLLSEQGYTSISNRRIILLWGVASALAIPIGLYVGSLITGVIGEAIFENFLGSDTSEETSFWFGCFGLILFLTLFAFTSMVIQWLILQGNFKGGWGIFFLVFIGVCALAEGISFTIGLRGIFIRAAMGLVWLGVQLFGILSLELAQFGIFGLIVGGISGAITGIIVIRKRLSET